MQNKYPFKEKVADRKKKYFIFFSKNKQLKKGVGGEGRTEF